MLFITLVSLLNSIFSCIQVCIAPCPVLNPFMHRGHYSVQLFKSCFLRVKPRWLTDSQQRQPFVADKAIHARKGTWKPWHVDKNMQLCRRPRSGEVAMATELNSTGSAWQLVCHREKKYRIATLRKPGEGSEIQPPGEIVRVASVADGVM